MASGNRRIPDDVMSKRNAETAGTRDEMGKLRSLPGMDSERLRTLVARLRVKSCADLKRALAAGKLVGLRGFDRGLRSRLQAALKTPDRS